MTPDNFCSVVFNTCSRDRVVMDGRVNWARSTDQYQRRE